MTDDLFRIFEVVVFRFNVFRYLLNMDYNLFINKYVSKRTNTPYERTAKERLLYEVVQAQLTAITIVSFTCYVTEAFRGAMFILTHFYYKAKCH